MLRNGIVENEENVKQKSHEEAQTFPQLAVDKDDLQWLEVLDDMLHLLADLQTNDYVLRNLHEFVQSKLSLAPPNQPVKLLADRYVVAARFLQQQKRYFFYLSVDFDLNLVHMPCKEQYCPLE